MTIEVAELQAKVGSDVTESIVGRPNLGGHFIEMRTLARLYPLPPGDAEHRVIFKPVWSPCRPAMRSTGLFLSQSGPAAMRLQYLFLLLIFREGEVVFVGRIRVRIA